MKPVLYIFSGLPGTGKSTLAQLLATKINATYLRIDTVEQALRDLCEVAVQDEGYRTAYKLAADNLALGINVIADSCNPVTITRKEWEAVAQAKQAKFINIELTCSNKDEHRRRVESRRGDESGFNVPTWEQVVAREYHPWQEPVLTIDTTGQTVAESFTALLTGIDHYLQ